MKSNLELNAEILEMTMKIRNNYPELSKYLEEMTITLPDDKHPDTNTKELQDYLNSLTALVSEYSESRDPSSEAKST
jgi:nitrate/nitrite-specific signal transduction histidine kinase